MTIGQVFRDVCNASQFIRTFSNRLQVGANLLLLAYSETWVGLDLEPSATLLTLGKVALQSHAVGAFITQGGEFKELHPVFTELAV